MALNSLCIFRFLPRSNFFEESENLKNELAKKSKDFENLQDELYFKNEKLAKLENSLNDKISEMEDLQKQLAEQNSKSADLIKSVERLSNEITEKSKIIDKLQSEAVEQISQNLRKLFGKNRFSTDCKAVCNRLQKRCIRSIASVEKVYTFSKSA